MRSVDFTPGEIMTAGMTRMLLSNVVCQMVSTLGGVQIALESREAMTLSHGKLPKGCTEKKNLTPSIFNLSSVCEGSRFIFQ